MPLPGKKVVAIGIGFLIGSMVNIAIVWAGPRVIPLPEGVDLSDMEKVAENIQLLKPANFLAPWLAHAVGTLVGAFVAAKLSFENRLRPALVVGILFLLGGITMVFMVGGPVWFILLDLAGAYLPMAFLGAWLAGVQGTRVA